MLAAIQTPTLADLAPVARSKSCATGLCRFDDAFGAGQTFGATRRAGNRPAAVTGRPTPSRHLNAHALLLSTHGVCSDPAPRHRIPIGCGQTGCLGHWHQDNALDVEMRRELPRQHAARPSKDSPINLSGRWVLDVRRILQHAGTDLRMSGQRSSRGPVCAQSVFSAEGDCRCVWHRCRLRTSTCVICPIQIAAMMLCG
jgi:hypothetical protein